MLDYDVSVKVLLSYFIFVSFHIQIAGGDAG